MHDLKRLTSELELQHSEALQKKDQLILELEKQVGVKTMSSLK
jgi:hypothetical protein